MNQNTVAILFPDGALIFMFIPMVCLVHSISLPGQPFPVAAFNSQQHLFSHRGQGHVDLPIPLPRSNTAHRPSILPFPVLPFDAALYMDLFCSSWSYKLFYHQPDDRIRFKYVREPLSVSILERIKLDYRDFMTLV